MDLQPSQPFQDPQRNRDPQHLRMHKLPRNLSPPGIPTYTY